MERADQTTIQITVQGDVQGVGFRWFTRRVAEGLGLSGTVANLPDGTVRIVARGSSSALEALQSSVRQGPPHARVVRVEVHEVPDLLLPGGGFEIVRC